MWMSGDNLPSKGLFDHLSFLRKRRRQQRLINFSTNQEHPLFILYLSSEGSSNSFPFLYTRIVSPRITVLTATEQHLMFQQIKVPCSGTLEQGGCLSAAGLSAGAVL